MTKEAEVKQPTIEQKVEEIVPTLIMSDEDRYIADRLKSQPKTLDEVLMVKEKKYIPGEHRLSLPKELKVYQDKFAFRWINKRKRAVDEAINKGWVIVNRVLFPDVATKAKHLFSTSGAIERGDAILSFMKKEIAEDIRRTPGIKSSAILKAQLERGKEGLTQGQSGFYQPKDTSSEKEDVGLEVGGGLQEGRDF